MVESTRAQRPQDGPSGLPDVFDPRVHASGIPHERFRFLRDHAPVARQEEPGILGWPAGPGFWAVTRHADVVRVLKDSGTYSSFLGATQIRDPAPADLPFIRRMMLNQDPPGHGRLRRLVSRAFTPGRVGRFTDTARARARRLLADAIDTGAGESVDLVRTVTDDYALLNLADLLGVPASDRELLYAWTERVIAYQDPDEPPVRDARGRPVDPRSPAMLAEMFGYAQELAAHKRAHPADDVMSVLAASELADAELEMFFFLLTVAGNDTVRAAAPGGLLALAAHPGEQARWWRGEVGAGTLVDELLRVHPPVLSFRRTAIRDTELAGQPIRRGDKVVVFHASANHDERVFADPHRLDLARDPNPHVSFGDGPHVCLGAHFARLQLRVLYEEMRSACGGIESAGPPRRLVSNFVNGVKSLPVRLREPSGPPR
ncbi:MULTISPECIES: cytochrome P450 [unclassified Streptomyces]|uniref:cytochrome P450 n=1 Tax=unclassified Streptomyces TaxID=2593676 RepID=UPI001660BC2C|nr:MULTISPECIES: cytochrome P450 [unclassified Streptomyces]MBD0711935.1 cytochrome [Streptomyces sp. CBMA291]MBD0713304.1 cytochrome [Streptomyces sp. CBMA370]